MQFNKRKVTIVVLFAISGIHMAPAQNAVDKLQTSVQISGRRLALAEQVAFAKWDSHNSIEDPSREAQVIMRAIKEGESRALGGPFVSRIFRAQIEANKAVQYSLLANWYRAGRAPAHGPVNLANSIRPELDRLQTALIAELANTANIRTGTTRHADVAKAVGKYMSSYKGNHWCLQAIALDRALAEICTL